MNRFEFTEQLQEATATKRSQRRITRRQVVGMTLSVAHASRASHALAKFSKELFSIHSADKTVHCAEVRLHHTLIKF